MLRTRVCITESKLILNGRKIRASLLNAHLRKGLNLLDCNLKRKLGAYCGNRTRIISLEGWGNSHYTKYASRWDSLKRLGACSGNRTRIISLEGWGNSHYTMPDSSWRQIQYATDNWKEKCFLSIFWLSGEVSISLVFGWCFYAHSSLTKHFGRYAIFAIGFRLVHQVVGIW